MRSAENRKGRDIGYALATRSCEGANSVEACTVTAPDAITAFAVPNPSGTSQRRWIFRVWLSSGSLRQTESPSLLRTGQFLFEPTLSAVDGSYPNIDTKNVNAAFWCSRKIPRCKTLARFASFSKIYARVFDVCLFSTQSCTAASKVKMEGNQRNRLTGRNILAHVEAEPDVCRN